MVLAKVIAFVELYVRDVPESKKLGVEATTAAAVPPLPPKQPARSNESVEIRQILL